MRTRAGVAIIAVVAAVLAMGPARAADRTVNVRNNAFDPRSISVDVGDRVVWDAIDGGHTVTPDDGRTACGSGTSVLAQGQAVDCTFTTDETFYYHCEIHGGMIGVVVVGEGDPAPPPGDEPSEIITVGPTGDHATISAAVGAALPRARIDVQPGTYAESVTVAKPGIDIVGLGAAPTDVVITAGFTRLTTVLLAGEDQSLRNVQVSGGAEAGVQAVGATDFTVADVTLTGNGRYGLLVRDSTGGWVQQATSDGNSTAGYAAVGCPTCDLVLDGVTATGNYNGVLIEDASSVVVRRSTIENNGNGILLRTTLVDGQSIDQSAPQRGSHILDNDITDNDSRTTPTPPIGATMPLRVGAGIWIESGSFDVIEHNRIDGHNYGVVVTGLTFPALQNRIVSNAVSGSRDADLAWDGAGANTCFAGNIATTSQPVEIETLYACSRPATIGVPYPIVPATLAGYAV